MISHLPYLIMIGVITLNAIYSSAFLTSDKISFENDKIQIIQMNIYKHFKQ